MSLSQVVGSFFISLLEYCPLITDLYCFSRFNFISLKLLVVKFIAKLIIVSDDKLIINVSNHNQYRNKLNIFTLGDKL